MLMETSEMKRYADVTVTADASEGDRPHMEDRISIFYSHPDVKDPTKRYKYFGVFDGHGGSDAADYVKQHLRTNILKQKNFWSQDDSLVLEAIERGFISTQKAMWKELHNWPMKNFFGDYQESTAGTTATIVFIRGNKLYTGHVGDSRLILGIEDTNGDWRAQLLTVDHKPDNLEEKSRIEASGGKVRESLPGKSARVIWMRPTIGHRGSVRRSTCIDEIPCLNVARSLGDFWSYNHFTQKFLVSPIPDVSVMELDFRIHRCLVLCTDGLYNVLTSQEIVTAVHDNELGINFSLSNPSSSFSTNTSTKLVGDALNRISKGFYKSDNLTVITVILHPPDQPISVLGSKNYKISNRKTKRHQLSSRELDLEDIDISASMTLHHLSPNSDTTYMTAAMIYKMYCDDTNSSSKSGSSQTQYVLGAEGIENNLKPPDTTKVISISKIAVSSKLNKRTAPPAKKQQSLRTRQTKTKVLSKASVVLNGRIRKNNSNCTPAKKHDNNVLKSDDHQSSLPPIAVPSRRSTRIRKPRDIYDL